MYLLPSSSGEFTAMIRFEDIVLSSSHTSTIGTLKHRNVRRSEAHPSRNRTPATAMWAFDATPTPVNCQLAQILRLARGVRVTTF